MRHMVLVAGLAAITAVSGCKSQDSKKPAADNTERNVRDRERSSPTADRAVNDSTDLALTQKIRRSVVSDDSLSITAKNVKIIVNDGTVTLKGPIPTTSERAKVEQIALGIAGDGKVVNQLEIAN